MGTGGELRALHVYMCVLARVFTCNEHSGLMSRLWAPAGGGGGGGGGAEGSVRLRVANKDDQSRFRYSPPCINHGGAREAAESKGGGEGGGGVGVGVSSDGETNPFFAYLRLTPPRSLSPPPDKSN